MKFDDTDVRLLRDLQKDARTNFADIAKECGVSVDTVIKRFQRLKRRGVVRGTTVLLDPRRLGLDCLSSLQVTAEPAQVSDVVEKIRAMPGVVFCTPSIGAQNVFAVAVQSSVSDLGSLKEEVTSLPAVRDVRASIWVGEVLLCPENFELERLKEGAA